ncbi:ATP-binding protein [Reichenbachiella agariperforans]|uniref:ATP-binding protein n=1 Tax=Reichenbachiella agariperforans TaxID=156994 RepID=UPI001C088C5D|nr:ATP-binding protein [Reichenbachiella agariperforans]MBU2912440.1 ATP-binding protein [Reichenbachiella agariperforans]
MELYERLKFKKNPFSTFSAEQERKFLDDVFIYPNNYNSLRSDITENRSRFIIGARGIGKTALIYKLKLELEEKNVFAILIDDFEGIPIKNNKKNFLKLMITETIKLFCATLSKNPSLLQNLDKKEKEKLSFIIAEFFKSLSIREYEEYYNKATHFKSRNFFRNIYNNLFHKPVNLLIGGGLELASDFVRKSFGLPDTNTNGLYKNYLPEIELETIKKSGNPSEFLEDAKALKLIWLDLANLINKSGFKTTTVLFDRADEYISLGQGIDSITTFLKELLTDTTILLSENYSIVIGLWDATKADFDQIGVRFDKIKPFNINWSHEKLKEILSKRIEHFSNRKVSLKDIFSESDINELIELSDSSPRYLFRQLSVIYDTQNNIDSEADTISKQAIQEGQLSYCRDFEFYAVFPSKKGSKEDILVNVNRILKIGSEEIKTKDYIDIAKVSTPTAISYIKIVQNYGLVHYVGETENGAKTYQVQNPVIKFLIRKNVKEISK